MSTTVQAPAPSFDGNGSIGRILVEHLPLRAAYRETPESDPVPCEIIGKKNHKLILRELGRPLVGVWAARRDQVTPPQDVDARDFMAWLRLNLWQMGAL